MNVGLSVFFLYHTCHGSLSYWKEVGHRVGEREAEDDVGVEQRHGEHEERGRHVDEVVNTQGDHQSELYSYSLFRF